MAMDQSLPRGLGQFGAPLSRTDWRGYALGVLSVAAALLVRWLLNPFLGEHQPYVTFFAAIAVTSMYGTLRGSVLALLLSVVAAVIFFLPSGLNRAGELDSTVSLAAFSAFAGLIVLSGELLRKARRRTAEEFAARTLAEEALFESEEQFRASFELAAIG